MMCFNGQVISTSTFCLRPVSTAEIFTVARILLRNLVPLSASPLEKPESKFSSEAVVLPSKIVPGQGVLSKWGLAALVRAAFYVPSI